MTLEQAIPECFDHAVLSWFSAPHLWEAVAEGAVVVVDEDGEVPEPPGSERWWEEMRRRNAPDLFRDGAPTA